MDKEDIALLKQAFQAELNAAEHGTPRMWRTEPSERADALEATGLLNKSLAQWQGETISGYELTARGRHEYLKATHQD
jgi:hypothetical protein